MTNPASTEISAFTLIVIAAITAGVPAVASIILFLLGQLFSERRQARLDAKLIESNLKLAENTEVTKKVEGLVNGLRTEALRDKVADTAKIAELQPDDVGSQMKSDMAQSALATHIHDLPHQ